MPGSANAERIAEAIGRFRRPIENIGGRHWRCLACSGTITADCECCEPPRCNCGERVRKTTEVPMERITVADFARADYSGREVYIETFRGLRRVRYLRWWPENPWIVTREEGQPEMLTESWCVHGGTTLLVAAGQPVAGASR